MSILGMSDWFGDFYWWITAESLKLKLENFTMAVGPISKMFPIRSTYGFMFMTNVHGHISLKQYLARTHTYWENKKTLNLWRLENIERNVTIEF